jgi:hypothetical protein
MGVADRIMQKTYAKHTMKKQDEMQQRDLRILKHSMISCRSSRKVQGVVIVNAIEKHFIDERLAFGYTQKQAEAELTFVLSGMSSYTGGPFVILPSTSRSAYVSEEEWEEGVLIHQMMGEDAKANGLQTTVVSGQ